MTEHEPVREAPAKPRRGLRKGVYVVPSLLTTGNIFCGFYAVTESFRGAVDVSLNNMGSASHHFDVAAQSIGWAVLFDFLDGRVARMTNSTTQFGVEFDSIADVLTFGIAPALLAFSWGYGLNPEIGKIAWVVSFMYLICGALRLARFNVQASKPALQKSSASSKVDKKAFVGMPIPAGASLIAAIVHFWPTPLSNTVRSFEVLGRTITLGPREWAVALLVLVASLAVLMVSTIRHTSFKNLGPLQRNPRLVILVIALLVTSVWFYSHLALLAMAGLYALHGVVGKIFGLFRRRRHGHQTADVALD
jgi:CDP-diacylglycerol--serine O-phosphatidyltransferase